MVVLRIFILILEINSRNKWPNSFHLFKFKYLFMYSLFHNKLLWNEIFITHIYEIISIWHIRELLSQNEKYKWKWDKHLALNKSISRQFTFMQPNTLYLLISSMMLLNPLDLRKIELKWDSFQQISRVTVCFGIWKGIIY